MCGSCCRGVGEASRPNEHTHTNLRFPLLHHHACHYREGVCVELVCSPTHTITPIHTVRQTHSQPDTEPVGQWIVSGALRVGKAIIDIAIKMTCFISSLILMNEYANVKNEWFVSHDIGLSIWLMVQQTTQTVEAYRLILITGLHTHTYLSYKAPVTPLQREMGALWMLSRNDVFLASSECSVFGGVGRETDLACGLHHVPAKSKPLCSLNSVPCSRIMWCPSLSLFRLFAIRLLLYPISIIAAILWSSVL